MREILVLLAVAAAAPVVVRWVVPVLARTLAALITHLVAALAAVLVLPDYCASIAARRRAELPPAWAYGYGSVVVDVLGAGLQVVRRLLRGLAVAAHAAPPILIAVAAVTLELLRYSAS